jgi:hypothetical protein
LRFQQIIPIDTKITKEIRKSAWAFHLEDVKLKMNAKKRKAEEKKEMMRKRRNKRRR